MGHTEHCVVLAHEFSPNFSALWVSKFGYCNSKVLGNSCLTFFGESKIFLGFQESKNPRVLGFLRIQGNPVDSFGFFGGIQESKDKDLFGVWVGILRGIHRNPGFSESKKSIVGSWIPCRDPRIQKQESKIFREEIQRESKGFWILGFLGNPGEPKGSSDSVSNTSC